MKIAHFMIGLQEPGGVSTYISRVGQAQEARGQEVIYVDLAAGPQGFQGAPIVPLGEPERLDAEMKRARVDLIHIHCDLPKAVKLTVPSLRTVHNNGANCLSGGKFLTRRGVPCGRPYSIPTCLIGHAVDRCGSLRPLKLLANIARMQSEFALLSKMRVIAVSAYLRDELVRAGHAASLIETLHSPAPEMQTSASVTEERVPRVLFAGRLCVEKGILWLLEAVRMLNGQVHLDIAGAGPEESRARESCATWSMEHYVSFHGWQSAEAITRLLCSCRAFVFPSLWQEPAGLVALEAMAAGRPIIASAVGGIPEFVQNGVNGILVPPNNAPALSEAIAQMATDQCTASRMGQAGRDLAMTRFTMTGHLESLDRIYQSVVSTFREGSS